MDFECKLNWKFSNQLVKPSALFIFRLPKSGDSPKIKCFYWKSKYYKGNSFIHKSLDVYGYVTIVLNREKIGNFFKRLSHKVFPIKQSKHVNFDSNWKIRNSYIYNKVSIVINESKGKSKRKKKKKREKDGYKNITQGTILNFNIFNMLFKTNKQFYVQIRDRVSFKKKRYLSLKSMFNTKAKFPPHVFVNMRKHINSMFDAIYEESKNDQKNVYRMLPYFCTWIATNVHSYVGDILDSNDGDGDYARSAYPRLCGDCEDLDLIISDSFYAIRNINIIDFDDKYFSYLKEESQTYHYFFLVTSTKGISAKIYGDNTEYHAPSCLYSKKTFFNIINGKKKKSSYNRAIMLESTDTISPFYDYELPKNITNIEAKKIICDGFGARYMKTGKDGYSFYKKVYQIVSPELYKIYGYISFMCTYKGDEGVPITKFLNGSKYIKFHPVKLDDNKYSTRKNSLVNLLSPFEEIDHIGSFFEDGKHKEEEEKEVLSFVKEVEFKGNDPKEGGYKVSDVFTIPPFDLKNITIRNKIRIIAEKHRVVFTRQDADPDNEYNKCTTFLVKIYKLR